MRRVLGVLVLLFLLPACTREEGSVLVPPNCDPQTPVADCLESWGLANLDYLDEVVQTLTLRSLEDGNFADTCHDAWHEIGKAAGARYPLATALQPWAYSCTGGYLHGVMATAPSREGLAVFKAAVPETCAKYETRPLVAYLDCWHGAGHGFAQELPFPESMYACKALAPGVSEFEWCSWGAAEFPDSASQVSPELLAKYENTLEDRCTDLETGYPACYRLVIPMMHMAGWEPGRIYHYCSSQPVDEQDGCALALGSVEGMRFLQDGIEPCAGVPRLFESCAAGLGRYLGRLSEWGIFDDDPSRKAEVGEVCTNLPARAGIRCRYEFDAIARIELSPAEEREVVLRW